MKGADRLRGSVSLLLSLILVPMLTLGGAVTDIVRYSGAVSAASYALRLTANGILARYDTSLYDTYGILAVSAPLKELQDYAEDTLTSMFVPADIFETASPSVRLAVNRRFGAQTGSTNLAFRNLTSVSLGEFSLLPGSFSSPASPTVLEGQILEFMKYRVVLQGAEKLLEKIGGIRLADECRTASDRLGFQTGAAGASEAARQLHRDWLAYEALLKEYFEEEAARPSEKKFLRKAAAALQTLREDADALKDALPQAERMQKLLREELSCMPPGEAAEAIGRELGELSSYSDSGRLESFTAAVEAALELCRGKEGLPEDSSAMLYCGTREEGGDSALLVDGLGAVFSSAIVEDKTLTERLQALTVGSLQGEAGEILSRVTSVSLCDICHCFDEIDRMANVAQTLPALPDIGVGSGGIAEMSGETAAGMLEVSEFLKAVGDCAEAAGDGLLTTEYLVGMFSCRTDKKENAATLLGGAMAQNPLFGAELEYLLFGMDTPSADLGAAYAAVLAIRYALNTAFIYSDAGMRSAALTAAAAMAGWTGLGVPVAENLVLLAWSAVETAMDMDRLKKGESVPVFKTPQTWTTGISGILPELGPAAGETASAPLPGTVFSMSYRDYLRVFFLMSYPLQSTAILARCAKLMQINLSYRNNSFVLTECWTAAYCRCSVTVPSLTGGVIVPNSSESGGETWLYDFSMIGKERREIEVSWLAAY